MFISINRTLRGEVHSAIYECARIAFHPASERPETVFVTLEGSSDGPLSFELEKKTSELFVMNEKGQTIDSYRW